ncbi:unnamed protein product, partial [Meganyctiphanes norvegica]
MCTEAKPHNISPMQNLTQHQSFGHSASSGTPLDEEFSWEEYMEETNTEGVPAPAFLHIEKSLESQVFVDELLEVENQRDDGHLQYWVARVVNICGPLLRLCFISPQDVNVHCWREVFSGGLHPLGHCASRDIPLGPPVDLAKQLLLPESLASAIESVQNAINCGKSVIAEALTENGFTHAQCIKTGMKLEVLSEYEAYSGWVATVMRNCGGRLLLCYDTPDSPGPYLWQFYQHHTLRPRGWIEKEGPPWRYFPPESNGKHSESDWKDVLKRSQEENVESFTPSVLCDMVDFISTSSLVPGMLMEAVNFLDPRTVHIAAVKEIIDENHIKIVLKTNADSTGDEISRITTLCDPLLFPKGFCYNHNIPLCPPSNWHGEGNFNWEKYLQSYPELIVVPEELFPKHQTAEDLGFEMGMRLEATNPVCRGDIGAATIEKIFCNILMVRLDSTVEKVQILMHAKSQELFPTGWCQTNKYPLRLPPDYCPNPKPHIQVSSSNISEKTTENSSSSSSQNSDSRWCPRIYVNHWCYTGPYLSKSKVAKQTQSVGPGSVELVLREVLNMTISAAYVPTRVLRELERCNGFNGPNVQPSWRTTTLKAKFKRYSYSATVPVATLVSDMSDYLSAICQTLQCCPNLWSTTQSGEACPLICYAQVQAVGSSTGNSGTSIVRSRGRPPLNRGSGGRWGNSTSRTLHRRKRGGRKRLFVPIRAHKPHHPKLLAACLDDLGEPLDDDYEDDLEGEDQEIAEAMSCSDEGGDNMSPSSRATSPSCVLMVPGKRKKRGFARDLINSLHMVFDNTRRLSLRMRSSNDSGNVGSTRSGGSESSGRLKPADVQSDPLLWTVDDVEHYVVSQPTISHHAPKLKDQQVDGRAFLLLNLPTLIHHLSLPHSSAVALAQHVCRVKLAHFMFYYQQPEKQRTSLPSQVF